MLLFFLLLFSVTFPSPKAKEKTEADEKEEEPYVGTAKERKKEKKLLFFSLGVPHV